VDVLASECLVFDIGGTSTRGGVYDPRTDAVVRHMECETPSYGLYPEAGREEINARLKETLVGLATRLGIADPKSVSVGIAGPVDSQGTARMLAPIYGPRGGALGVRDMLESIFGCRVYVYNDMTMAGIGLAHQADDFAVVMISSGLGLRVFLEGRPVVGADGWAGELGHLVVDPDPAAGRCECGLGTGHLSRIASGRGLLRTIQAAAVVFPEHYGQSQLGEIDRDSLTPREIAAAYRSGDSWVESLVNEAISRLGYVLAIVYLATGVECFYVMGGFADGLGEKLRSRLIDVIMARCPEYGQSWRDVVQLVPRGDLIALRGAGRLASGLTRTDGPHGPYSSGGRRGGVPVE
jgi:predicted NBD/HSP70 family sugar kinase